MNVEPSADEIKVSTMNNRSRVAVFKDTEKDRSDPDYDRNYKRLAYPLVNSCSHKFMLMMGWSNIYPFAGMLVAQCLTST